MESQTMASDLPTSEGLAVIGVFVAMPTIAAVTVALRVFVILRVIKRRIVYEDLFAGMGCLLYLAFSGLAAAGPFYGIGQHAQLIPLAKLEKALQLSWCYELIFVLANMAVKQGIALMLLRYAVEDLHKKFIYVVTFALQFYSMIEFFAILFQCIPMSYFWTRVTGAEGRCMNPVYTIRLTYGYSALFVVYDLTMALLPWFMVRKLQLDLRTRLMVTSVLALGSIACIVTITRVPFIAKLATSEDWLYDDFKVSILSCFETGLSIVASSAATLKPLFRSKSTQASSSSSVKTPKLNTFPTTTQGSSTAATLVENDVEFATVSFGPKA